MPKVRNISNGPRGAYLKGVFVQAEPGEEIDADDFAEEWFALSNSAKAKAASKDDNEADGKDAE